FDTEPDELRAAVRNRVSAFVGHSGVGKSTLVNALVPNAAQVTASVSAVGKGRHTSITAIALPLPEGGWVVDTPGIRSFGLAHITATDIVSAFDEFAPLAEECPPGCNHLGEHIGQPEEPDCMLDTAVAAGAASAGRLASLRRLLMSRAGTEDLADQ
ncbi:MAG: GTPase RsgA, partial [Sciscionella sp.]